MTALIAKDENFKTIGMLVTENNIELFRWGTTPNTSFNFVKEVNLTITELMKLKRIQDELKYNENFFRDFFDVALDNDCLKKGKDGNPVGVRFTRQDDNVKMLKEQLERIMQDFK